MVGTGGTGGGLVPMSHLGLSLAVPADILEGWRRTVRVGAGGVLEDRLCEDDFACNFE